MQLHTLLVPILLPLLFLLPSTLSMPPTPSQSPFPPPSPFLTQQQREQRARTALKLVADHHARLWRDRAIEVYNLSKDGFRFDHYCKALGGHIHWSATSYPKYRDTRDKALEWDHKSGMAWAAAAAANEKGKEALATNHQLAECFRGIEPARDWFPEIPKIKPKRPTKSRKIRGWRRH